MTVTVDPITNGDFTRIDRADALTNWTTGDGWSMELLNTSSQVENTGCIEVRVPAGIGSLFATFTSRSLENVHLRMWVKAAQSISAGATYGARLINGDDTNHGSWIVYDEDKQVGVYNGWWMLVVDPRKPYDAVVGTAPADILAIVDAGCRVDFVDGNGKSLVAGDMIWEGNEVSVEGGTTGARGTVAEWSAADRTAGYGIMRVVGGVYYMNAGAVFQGVGTADNFFEDLDQLIVFEDLPVSGSLYTFRHVGNATSTDNRFQLGVSSGTGVDQEGASGGVMRAAGAAPFRIEAIDANVDAVNYYGVTMLGPSAAYADQPRNIKTDDGGAFTDITAVANGGAGRADQALLPATEAVNDAVYFGHDKRFYTLNLNLSIGKGGGVWTGTWEYYDGTAWQSLTDVTDGTANMATTGAQVVDWAIPDDWAANAIDSDTRYWVRFRISAFTSSGTIVTQDSSANGVTVDMAGDIRLEDANVDMVSCTLAGMGSIRVRNGAFLKKCTIDASRSSAKHAAVDLGNANPTADTVRDLSIQNCSKGILLKGTSSGTTTYNFPNIQFSGNTNDVRVDFPVGATVVINVLEGGDTPSVDNVNSSTVTINNTVSLTVTVLDEGGVAVEGARVRIEESPGGVLIANGTTNASGIFTDSTYSFGGNQAVTTKVRLKGFKNFRTAGTIVSTGLGVGVTFQTDTIVDLP